MFIFWKGCLVQRVQKKNLKKCDRKQRPNCVTAGIHSIPLKLTSKQTPVVFIHIYTRQFTQKSRCDKCLQTCQARLHTQTEAHN